MLIERLAIALAVLVTAVIVLRPPDQARQARRGDAWARKHQAFVDRPHLREFDRLLDAPRRRHAWLLVMVAVCIAVVPLPAAWGVLPWLAATCAASTVMSALFLRRWILGIEPGPRVARARQVELGDYLPDPWRALMWVSVLALAVFLILALRAPEGVHARVFLGLMVTLLGGAAFALEMMGRRLARTPEPAVDQAHLYWQDAMRADLVTSHARQTCLGAAISCGALSENGLLNGVALNVLATLTGLGLVTWLTVCSFRELDRPAAHVQARLWSGLGAGDIAGPPAGATA
jgi:hypothetical protein